MPRARILSFLVYPCPRPSTRNGTRKLADTWLMREKCHGRQPRPGNGSAIPGETFETRATVTRDDDAYRIVRVFSLSLSLSLSLCLSFCIFIERSSIFLVFVRARLATRRRVIFVFAFANGNDILVRRTRLFGYRCFLYREYRCSSQFCWKSFRENTRIVR